MLSKLYESIEVNKNTMHVFSKDSSTGQGLSDYEINALPNDRACFSF